MTHKEITEKYGILIAELWKREHLCGLANGHLYLKDKSSIDVGEGLQLEATSLIKQIPHSEGSGLIDPEHFLTQTRSTVKAMMKDSLATKNGGAWPCMHLSEHHSLCKYYNQTLLQDILALDPQSRRNEGLLRSELRRELRIKNHTQNEDFQWHGKLIPSAVFDYSFWELRSGPGIVIPSLS